MDFLLNESIMVDKLCKSIEKATLNTVKEVEKANENMESIKADFAQMDLYINKKWD